MARRTVDRRHLVANRYPPSKATRGEAAQGLLTKAFVWQWLLTLLKNNDAQTIYYTLAGVKLVVELTGLLGLTQDERGLLQEALQSLSQPREQSKPGKKLADIFPDRTAQPTGSLG